MSPLPASIPPSPGRALGVSSCWLGRALHCLASVEKEDFVNGDEPPKLSGSEYAGAEQDSKEPMRLGLPVGPF